MKALQISEYGGADVIKLNADAPKPTIGADTVLVEVYVAGVNPVDWSIRAGYLKEMMPLKFPATLGVDFSGVVANVGKNVSDFKLGDEVYGMANAASGGSFAEYTAVPATSLAHKPAAASHTEAAALPLAGLSAWQALKDQAKLAADQKILIHGGAGGIGTIAVQLAKHIGAYVATTVHADDKEYATALGADAVIDYEHEKFEDSVSNYDVVFDTVGGEVFNRSFAVLKKGGVIVSMVEQPNEELAKEHGVTALGQFTQPNSSQLSQIAQWVDSGKVKIEIEHEFPLDEGGEALEYLKRDHRRGKVVITIKLSSK